LEKHEIKNLFDLNVYFVRILIRFKLVLITHKVCNPFKTLLTQSSNIHAVEFPDPYGTLKHWISGFVFSIKARSASALAVAFFRLLDLHSYAHFDILKLIQPSPVFPKLCAAANWCAAEEAEVGCKSFVLTKPYAANLVKSRISQGL